MEARRSSLAESCVAETAESAGAGIVRLESRRFGSAEVPLSAVFTLDPGLVGFPGAHRFVLLDRHAGSPFKWMVCLDQPELGFVVTDPVECVPGYVRPTERAATVLSCEAEDVALFVLVTIPKEPKEIFLNLLAPIAVDLRSARGLQMVLEDGSLDPAHRVPLA
jgi:flagellar assembly factor FliW